MNDVGEVWYPCDKCDYKAKQAGNLKQHKANVHDIDVVWHPCDKCDYKAKTATNLKRHRAKVHKSVNISTGEIVVHKGKNSKSHGKATCPSFDQFAPTTSKRKT